MILKQEKEEIQRLEWMTRAGDVDTYHSKWKTCEMKFSCRFRREELQTAFYHFLLFFYSLPSIHSEEAFCHQNSLPPLALPQTEGQQSQFTLLHARTASHSPTKSGAFVHRERVEGRRKKRRLCGGKQELLYFLLTKMNVNKMFK